MPELQQPVDNGAGNLIVRATDQSLHRGYIFYIRITIDRVNLEYGDTIAFLGPYDLRVGCWSGTVEFTDSPQFIPTRDLWVGDSLFSVYVFEMPTANQTWCPILETEIMTGTGATWTDAPSILP